MSEVLNVEARDGSGSSVARRLRRNGMVPAVLYGHGEPNVCLSVKASNLAAVMRHGAHVVTLSGALSDQALIKDMQWDALGNHVLHIDLFRVRSGERIEVTVSLNLKGEAPGAAEGGMIEQPLYELAIECEARDVPDSLDVNISGLKLGHSLLVSDLKLPAGMTAVTPADSVVVSCSHPVGEVEGAEATGEAEEPEVIGGAAEAEGDDSNA